MIVAGTLGSRAYTQAITAAMRLVIPGFVLAVTLGVCLFSLDSPPLVFRSPDENAGYLFTRVLADTGKTYYENDSLVTDSENLLHPRGVLSHEGRGVPVAYFGLPVLYAPIYKILGTDLRYVALPMAALTICALAGIGSLIAPQRQWLAWLACLSFAPVLFYLGRPLLNSAPAFAFTSVGVYFLLRYATDRKPAILPNLLLSAAFLSLAAFARYELAIFATLLVAIVLLHKHGSHFLLLAKHFAGFSLAVGLLFVVPVLALNSWTYGSPAEFGQSLFNQAYFPERWSSDAGNSLSLLRQIRGVLLPAYPIDPLMASKSLVFQVLGVIPVVAAVALAGLVTLAIRRDLPLRIIGLCIALGFYVFFYRGAGESWLAGTTTPNLEASVIRYSLPLYIGVYCLLVYVLSRIGRAEVSAAISVGLVIAGIYGTVWHLDGNVSHIRQQLIASEQMVATRILPNTESDALIYTDVYDKILNTRRDVATWWGSAGKNEISHFESRDVAASISRNVANRPVYLLLGDVDFFLPQITSALEERALAVEATAFSSLYRVVAITPPLR